MTNINYESNEYDAGWDDGYRSAIADMVKLMNAIGLTSYDDSTEALAKILDGGLAK